MGRRGETLATENVPLYLLPYPFSLLPLPYSSPSPLSASRVSVSPCLLTPDPRPYSLHVHTILVKQGPRMSGRPRRRSRDHSGRPGQPGRRLGEKADLADALGGSLPVVAAVELNMDVAAVAGSVIEFLLGTEPRQHVVPRRANRRDGPYKPGEEMNGRNSYLLSAADLTADADSVVQSRS